MSEQLPEGDNVVLGKGGTFEMPNCGFFIGWWRDPDTSCGWKMHEVYSPQGCYQYAAPRDSEVARLNGLDKPVKGRDPFATLPPCDHDECGPYECKKPPAVHGEVDITMQDVRLHVGEGCLTNADILKGCSIHMRRKSADKDALIRGLVEALEFYADVSKYPVPKTGGLGELYFDCGDTAKAALRQAEQGGGA